MRSNAVRPEPKEQQQSRGDLVGTALSAIWILFEASAEAAVVW